MRNLVRLVGITLAALAAVGFLGIGHALAAQQQLVTQFSGSTSGTGSTWTRTITDVSEPNEPNGGTIQAIYNINVPWTGTPSQSAMDIATAYLNAADAALPGTYTVVLKGLNPPTVRVTKTTGTFSFVETTPPPTGIILTNSEAGAATSGPIASPVGLASLAAGLAALAYWNRRRRQSA